MFNSKKRRIQELEKNCELLYKENTQLKIRLDEMYIKKSSKIKKKAVKDFLKALVDIRDWSKGGPRTSVLESYWGTPSKRAWSCLHGFEDLLKEFNLE